MGDPRRSLLSPGGLLRLAALLALLFGLLHLAGGRPYTAVFSGTPVTGEGDPFWGALLGASYALTYLAAVVAAPALALGGILLAGWSAWRGREGGRRTPPGGAKARSRPGP